MEAIDTVPFATFASENLDVPLSPPEEGEEEAAPESSSNEYLVFWIANFKFRTNVSMDQFFYSFICKAHCFGAGNVDIAKHFLKVVAPEFAKHNY